MKKISFLMYFINILCGILLLINYLFIYNYKVSSIFIFILFLLLYAFFSIRFIKNKKDIIKKDVLFMVTYYMFFMFIIIVSVILQAITSEIYNLVYFEFILMIPHLLYLFYFD